MNWRLAKDGGWGSLAPILFQNLSSVALRAVTDFTRRGDNRAQTTIGMTRRARSTLGYHANRPLGLDSRDSKRLR